MRFLTNLPPFWSLRLAIFVSACISLGVLLGARLVHVQLVQGADFEARADSNRFSTLLVPAERGVLLDRYGESLVWNTQRYYTVANPDDLYFQQLPISRQEALSLMASSSSTVVTSMERLYRYPEALSHTLGYVGPATAEELASGRALTLTDRVGKLGLELSQNAILRGQDGKEVYEVNAIGRRQKLVSREDPVPGKNITTTLDPYLSQVAYQALGDKKGVVIIMNAQTGEVLSLVSSPSYNPNYLSQTSEDVASRQERQQQVAAMFSDERQLFFNRAINGIYPPGSVFKLVTALAGLEENKLDASTQVVDEGVLTVGDYQYGNWYFRQYGRTEGSISLVRAISRSNDIYFYKAAEWIGPNMLAQMARLFGYGQPTAIQLRPQARGLVPDPAWKEQNMGERWYLGNTYHFGIGQGDMLVTPLQVAQMTQALGHEGTLCPPTILADSPSKCTEIGIRKQNLDLVLRGMIDACSAGGTAFPFFEYNAQRLVPGGSVDADLANGAVACKTGTAEFGGLDANNHRRTHGWLVALADFDSLELANAGGVAETESGNTALVATESAKIALDVVSGLPSHSEWVKHVQEHGFPRRLAFVAMIESDDELPFVEGSRDAGPVIKTIIDWMWGDATVGARFE